MSRVTTMPRVRPITCVTNVQEEGYVLSAIDMDGAGVFLVIIDIDLGDFEGILDQSFVGMFTSLGKSQYVASTFATTLKTPTTEEQRFFKGVCSEVNSMGAFHHYMFVNVDFDPGNSHIKRMGVLIASVGVKEAPLRVFSLKGSAGGAFVLPFRVLTQKKI